MPGQHGKPEIPTIGQIDNCDPEPAARRNVLGVVPDKRRCMGKGCG